MVSNLGSISQIGMSNEIDPHCLLNTCVFMPNLRFVIAGAFGQGKVVSKLAFLYQLLLNCDFDATWLLHFSAL